MPSIAVVNKSTILTHDVVRDAVAAVQKQVLTDFASYGWPSAEVAFYSDDLKPAPADQWQMVVLDDTTQAGALGYHDLPQSGAIVPIGYVFAKTCQQFGINWTTTLSHEVLEMLADPWICEAAYHQTSNTDVVLYCWEVCDACENQSYQIDGISVSDFVTPAWFEDWRAPNSTKFDHLGTIRAPLTLAAGGYISTFTPGSGWQQVSQGAAARMQARIANGKFTRSQRRMNRK